ncbi:MAG TPA: hypothetical protein DCQ34_06015 [Chitinophagaceae bacterium]|nr:hypothetical protein [Chitinophagaceae bacterium]
MKLPGFILNKYTVSALILLALLGTDILLHKGMSRVMLPEPFTDRVQPMNIQPAASPLKNQHKYWVRGVNDPSLLQGLKQPLGGIECDVYFDSSIHSFYVYHDSSRMSTIRLDSLLQALQKMQPESGVWLDMKNLEPYYAHDALKEVNRIRDTYHLQERLIIESARPDLLKAFTDSGYYSSYYIPFLNPYQANEDSIVGYIEDVGRLLKEYPSSAVSGYYFQYPLVRKFFPNYPILTWTNDSYVSLVTYSFNRMLNNDEMVKVVLYPVD